MAEVLPRSCKIIDSSIYSELLVNTSLENYNFYLIHKYLKMGSSPLNSRSRLTFIFKAHIYIYDMGHIIWPILPEIDREYKELEIPFHIIVVCIII